MSLQKYPIDPAYSRYLKDESGLAGFADAIVFPENLEEIRSIVGETARNRGTVTVQGGLTGLCGGAVPCGGIVVNLSRFAGSPVLSGDQTSVTVAAGTNLQDLGRYLQEKTGGRSFFPVEPTEKTATVGGILAQNAGGLTRQKYGGLETYVKRLTVVDSGAAVRAVDDPDQIRAYLGSEGMGGIIAEAELALLPVPREVWSMVFFFETLEGAAAFSGEIVRQDRQKLLTVLEIFDRDMIRLVEEHREDVPDMKQLPELGPDWGVVLLAEVSADSEERIEAFVSVLVELSERFGCDADRAWVASGRAEAEKIRNLKHAATESVRMFYTTPDAEAAGFRRADLVLHGPELIRDLAEIRRSAESVGLRCCICGHIGLKQVSVTLLSREPEEFERFCRIRKEYWRRNPPSSIGEISEYGIGKLHLDRISAEDIVSKARGRLLKRSGGLFNPGNMTKAI